MTNKELAFILMKHVEAYKKLHPMRKADVHTFECLCDRCFVDFAEGAAKRLASTQEQQP